MSAAEHTKSIRKPRAWLYLCNISYAPYTVPVASPDGIIFDEKTIKRVCGITGYNPVSGDLLSPTQLVSLRFSINPETGRYYCPILHKTFDQGVKVVTHAETGNVFSFDAVKKHNLESGFMYDLLSKAPINSSGIITLFDPAKHFMISLAQNMFTSPMKSKEPPRCSQKAQHKPAAILRGLRSNPASGNSVSCTTNKKAQPLPKHRELYHVIPSRRDGKGFVVVSTNVGTFGIELHCDQAPNTCRNFIRLVEEKFYDGLTWSKIVLFFRAETGDTTGTGEERKRKFGDNFINEIRASLSHDEPGVVGMANHGADMNAIRWYVCFNAAPLLNGTHTVFGKVVEGLSVLSVMQTEAARGHMLFIDHIEVIFNPFLNAS